MTTSRLPNLVVAGVPRAGTTSLFTYLSRHPDICGSSLKETNYFLPAAHGKETADQASYAAYFRHCRADASYLLEASPRYFLGKAPVARAINGALGQSVRVIVSFRDPAKRLFSFFNFKRKHGQIDWAADFGGYTRDAIGRFREMQSHLQSTGETTGVNYYLKDVRDDGLSHGIYVHFLADWLAVFGDRLKIVFFEDLAEDPAKVLQEICAWLQLGPHPHEAEGLTPENRSAGHRSIALLKVARALGNRFLPQVGPLRRALVRAYRVLNEAPERDDGAPSEAIEALREFYDPYNRQLRSALAKEGYSPSFPAWLRDC